MTRNAIRLTWLLFGPAILSAVTTLPALAQFSRSAAATDSSNAQERQAQAKGDTSSTLNVMPVAATQDGVSRQNAITSGPTGFAAPAGAHLNYYGGPIITNVQVIQVLYGSGSYEPHVAGTNSPTMGQFFGDITGSGSGLATLLWQYNTNLSGGTNQFSAMARSADCFRSLLPAPTTGPPSTTRRSSQSFWPRSTRGACQHRFSTSAAIPELFI
jgi:hypothetical protein